MTTQMKESVSAWPNSSPAFRPDTNPEADRKIRVAFVEDDDDYREAVSNELADYGFDVTSGAGRSIDRVAAWPWDPTGASCSSSGSSYLLISC